MNDKQILDHIGELVAEEHALWNRSAQAGLEPEEHERLAAIKIQLDQLWDLLDQRRALRDAGRDPSQAKLRDANIVENYQQ